MVEAHPSPPPLTTVRLDAHAIRVLAHPLRARILSALRLDGPSTATTLARSLGTNTGATSYHLRKLEEIGLVEETNEGRGKERWKRASTAVHQISASSVAGDPDAAASLTWLQQHYFARVVEGYSAWIEESPASPIEWQDALSASDYLLTLSTERAGALQADLDAVIDRYRVMPPEADADTRQVSLNVLSFPVQRKA